MKQFSTIYTYWFSLALCLACSVVLASAAVMLRERQSVNQQLDKQKSVLLAANLADTDDTLTQEKIEEKFSSIESRVVDLKTDNYVEDVEAGAFDEDEVARIDAPANRAGIREIPEKIQIFHVMKDGEVDMLVLPIEGQGLWGTLYGFLALDSDTTTVKGITYYDHKETPGLGGEVDNPRWKNRWPGRKVYDGDWNVAIEVVKGSAGPAADAPHSVDGLSGATITSRGVTHMLHFWLGEEGFGPYLEQFREQRSG